MAQRRDEFSLHEMEEHRRRRAQGGAAPSERGDGSSPEAPARAWPPEDEAPPEALHRHPVPEGESLQLRRSLRVLRRHWLVVLLVFAGVPAIVFLLDRYLRDEVWVAKVRCVERDVPDARDLRLGPVPIALRAEQTEGVRRVLHSEDLDGCLRELADAYIRERQGLPAADKQFLTELRQVFGDPQRSPPPGYLEQRGMLTVQELHTGEMEITVRGGRPEVHKLVARLLVPAFNDVARAKRVARIEDARDRLRNEQKANGRALSEVRVQLAEVTRQIRAYEPDRDELAQVEDPLREARLRAANDLADLERRLALLKRDLGWEAAREQFHIQTMQDIDAVLVAGNHLREKWRELVALRAEMRTRYTDEHPRLREVEREIEGVRAELRREGNVTSLDEVPPLPTKREEKMLAEIRRLDRERELAAARVADLEERAAAAEPATVEDPLAGLPESEQEKLRALTERREALLVQLDRHREQERLIYHRLDDLRLLLAQVKEQRQFDRIGSVVSYLESPRIRLDVLLGAVLGLILGAAVAFLLEGMDTRLHTPFDVYYHLRLNYLGVIPHWEERETVTIAPENPDSHIATVYEHLRNNIRYARTGGPERCLLVASARQGEGKSTIAANLAISYALEGNNVVLIDADLRRPRGHKLVDILQGNRSLQHGLSDHLGGEARYQDVVYGTSVPGLNLIPAGAHVRNPAKLLGSAQMKSLLEQAQANFDNVIIDCPAVLPVVDASTLSGHVRGVLVVIAAEEVEVGAVRMALYRLRHVGSPVVGAVLNKVRERATSYYYYGYRSGEYYLPYGERTDRLTGTRTRT